MNTNTPPWTGTPKPIDAPARLPDAGPPPAQPASAPADIFANLASLRLGSNVADSSIQFRTTLRTLPVRKPSKEMWIRTNPDEAYRFATNVIELREEREIYLVGNDLWSELVSEPTFGPRLLVTAISRPGNTPFLWPLKLPGDDGRLDSWSRSALDIACGDATTSWVRVVGNMTLGGYQVILPRSSDPGPEPKWPDMPFSKLLELAFRDKFIRSFDHPVLRRLRGEI